MMQDPVPVLKEILKQLESMTKLLQEIKKNG